MFRRIYQWLKRGGYLLTTLTHFSEKAYTEDDFHGVTMYWSNYGLDDYKEILAETGFRLLETSAMGHNYPEAHDTSDEHHPLVFAQKASIGRVAV